MLFTRQRKLIIIVTFILLVVFLVVFVMVKKNEVLAPIELPMTPVVVPVVEPYQPKILKHIPVTSTSCNDEKDTKKKEVCEDRLKLKEFIEEENAKLCLTLTENSNRNECLLYIATKFQLDDICQAINDAGRRAVCLDRITIETKDVKRCVTNFEGEPHEIAECVDRIMAFEVIENDLEIDQCNEISTLEYPNLCRQGLFINKYKRNCELVPARQRDYCLSYFALTEAREKEDCDKIPLDDYKEYCYLKIETEGDVNKMAKIDSDGDRLPDGDELFTSTDPHNPDTDFDGLEDWDEIFYYHTNPSLVDSDGDKLEDGDEVKNGTNPAKFDSDDDGSWDNEDDDPFSGDTDHDWLMDVYEKIIGTDPNNMDTDGDGMIDGEEFFLLRDPLGDNWQRDSDKDGLIDIDEVFYRTNGLIRDSDKDGILDGDEVKNLTNPLGEGDMDFDGDGLTDKEELKYKTNPTKVDTNDDGISDYDSAKRSIDPLLRDSDGDGIDNRRETLLGYDLLDADMDDDGLSDGDEVNKYYTDPTLADTDNDGYSDGIEVESGRNPRGE